MKVKGMYYEDSNFVYLFEGKSLYTIAKNSGDWGVVTVGGYTAFGQKVTQSDL